MNGAVIALTPRGRKLALLVGGKTGFAVYLPARLKAWDDCAIAFTSLREVFAASFSSCRRLVLVMATGIAVRMIAPFLKDKRTDPAVVVMDERGRYVISLLSGHWGGANELACQLAGLLGGEPVITTATDVNGLTAVDVFAREVGLIPEPFAMVKKFNAALLRGETVAVFTDYPHQRLYRAVGLRFFPVSEYARFGDRIAYRAILTHLAKYPGAGDDLYLRPPNLYVGVGCRRGVTAAAIKEHILQVLRDNNLALASVAGLASIDKKKHELGLHQAARELGVPLCFFDTEEIKALAAPYQASDFVYNTMGVGGVCEPAAMLAAGSNRLLVPRRKREGVTVAVALAAFPWSGLVQAGENP